MNKKNKTFQRVSVLLLFSFLLAVAGCGKDTTRKTVPETETASDLSEGGVIGEGSREFAFTVVEKDGKETEFEVHTEKETVGEALLELGLISGEEGEYGLYVKTVNGVTADFDADGVYWAFYINDEYAQTSVDMTKIEDGASYSFRIE